MKDDSTNSHSPHTPPLLALALRLESIERRLQALSEAVCPPAPSVITEELTVLDGHTPVRRRSESDGSLDGHEEDARRADRPGQEHHPVHHVPGAARIPRGERLDPRYVLASAQRAKAAAAYQKGRRRRSPRRRKK